MDPNALVTAAQVASATPRAEEEEVSSTATPALPAASARAASVAAVFARRASRKQVWDMVPTVLQAQTARYVCSFHSPRLGVDLGTETKSNAHLLSRSLNSPTRNVDAEIHSARPPHAAGRPLYAFASLSD
jgi:hypothetical protein